MGGPAPPARLPHLCAGDSQVCDIVHDGEAFDGVALAVDEVVVDLERQTDGRAVREKDGWPGTVEEQRIGTDERVIGEGNENSHHGPPPQ